MMKRKGLNRDQGAETWDRSLNSVRSLMGLLVKQGWNTLVNAFNLYGKNSSHGIAYDLFLYDMYASLISSLT